MSTDITPNSTLTFTVKAVPPTTAKVKTIQRLMWMQPDVTKGMRMLQRRRRQTDNITYVRAGRPWTIASGPHGCSDARRGRSSRSR